MPPAPHVRRRVLVTGIVQGVGFRPFVHRLASARGLAGFVRNTSEGVEVEVQGVPADLDALVHALRAAPPPLARVSQIVSEDVPLLPAGAFEILESQRSSGRSWLPPDVGLCDTCRQELGDPRNRRFRHPFITCTDCGPRYTIVRGLPYDRAATTMASFAMCDQCRTEYGTPGGRRFHAEPIACLDCGPRVWLEPTAAAHGSRADGPAALARAVDVLASGGILAVKGVGGFHLMCDAAHANAVDTLRRRKRRLHKPFAIVTADLTRAHRVGVLSARAERDLASPARPIVIVDTRAGSDVALGVAPHLRQIGVMLPHAPLHELLVSDWADRVDARGTGGSAALVMTSGNRSEEPVVIHDHEARAGLAAFADALLLHDRPILMRADDSVVAANDGRPAIPIRRSRGQSPTPLSLPHARRPVLAVGGELKAAFCLALDGHAVLSPHIGDMENAETLEAFSAGVDHFCRVLRVEPDLYVCDAHPGYLSARWAEDAAAGRLLRVQHHHAHAASLMAEHGLGPGNELLTVCFDGTGYGLDGAIWGGEVLVARYEGFQRVAHLDYAPLPGGDSAARHPARLALAYLERVGLAWDDGLAATGACTAAERRLLADQLRSGTAVVPTSSMGRLFDVVSALAGVCQHATYEGQAAVELEAAAGAIERPARDPYRFSIEGTRPLRIQWEPVLRAVAADAMDGVGAGAISQAFHQAVARLVADVASELLHGVATPRVGLTGGVFQNVRLLGLTCQILETQGVQVLTHRVVPPNDGGLSLGQAAIGAARLPPPDWT